jgi:peptidoglycan/LPS O-acetylase OafA/YrhL
MNTLYYASLQWSLYLVFALLAWGSQQGALMRLLSTCEERLGGPAGAFTTVLLVSHVTLWAGAMLHPSMLQTFSPLLYRPAFLSGVCAARLLLHLAAAARAPAARTPGWHDMLIAHGSDVLSACLVWLVFAPWGLGTLDTVVALCVIPPLMCVCVLLLGLHVLRPGGRRSTPLLLWLLYDTEAAVNLGKLSFAIYLYHECLGEAASLTSIV